MKTEKSTKHTPGPWVVSGCFAGNRPLVQTQTESFSPIIAEVCDDGGRLPSQINARIIAAAPELLAALRDLLETVERIGPPPIQIGTLCEETDWRHDVEKAKAAIAKAQGERKIVCLICG